MAPYSSPYPRGIARPAVSAALLTLCAPAFSACGSSGDDAEAGGTGAAVTSQVTEATGTKVKMPAASKRRVAPTVVTLGGTKDRPAVSVLDGIRKAVVK
ncbi:hypothetical protein [Streptomyces atroolivaceus]|uniref:hypothetical protein n=1 Tax=Streptomyces atroolivaceus TaxID=66869 RepID=UPI00369A36EA